MNGTERAVLDMLASKLTADGYDVYIEPPDDILPVFMGGYRPDAIALGKTKKLAIEVVSDRKASTQKLMELERRFVNIADWELLVYYVPLTSASEKIPPTSRPAIDSAFHSVEQLQKEGQNSAALLMGWASLEALARLLQPEKFSRPQPARNLIEGLAADGMVTPAEADRLRELARLRNRLTHGDLSSAVTSEDLSEFLSISRAMRNLQESDSSPAR